VRRALAILRAFGPADRGLPLGEIARRAELDKATTRRLLRTLMVESLITQAGNNRDYSLSAGVLALSGGATPVDKLRYRAQSLLASIAQSTGATAFIVVPQNGFALCIESMAGAWDAPPPVAIGVRLPFNLSSAPRVLLAHLPTKERADVLALPFPAVTPTTPTDPRELAARADIIRARGWEASMGHVVEGISGLAVPVHDSNDQVIAAIGIAGPDAMILDGGEPRHLDLLLSRVRNWEAELPHDELWAPDPRPHVSLMAEDLRRSL
jgi:DNA-binding IclR family transcriptional regulator